MSKLHRTQFWVKHNSTPFAWCTSKRNNPFLSLKLYRLKPDSIINFKLTRKATILLKPATFIHFPQTPPTNADDVSFCGNLGAKSSLIIHGNIIYRKRLTVGALFSFYPDRTGPFFFFQEPTPQSLCQHWPFSVFFCSPFRHCFFLGRTMETLLFLSGKWLRRGFHLRLGQTILTFRLLWLLWLRSFCEFRFPWFSNFKRKWYCHFLGRGSTTKFQHRHFRLQSGCGDVCVRCHLSVYHYIAIVGLGGETKQSSCPVCSNYHTHALRRGSLTNDNDRRTLWWAPAVIVNTVVFLG